MQASYLQGGRGLGVLHFTIYSVQASKGGNMVWKIVAKGVGKTLGRT